MSGENKEYEECGECGHYASYCPPGGSSCSAWDPDRDDNKCACSGRKPPKPKLAPAIPIERDIDEEWL